MAGRAVLRKLRSGAYRAMDSVGAKVFPETDQPLEHWVRIEMDKAIGAYLDGLDTSRLTAAEISGSAQSVRPWKEFDSLDYPEFDLCAPLDGVGGYDVVICEQVLEHVVNPIDAVANLRGLVKPGGTVIVSTPFMIRVHELPAFGMHDYWRFTPRGLELLLTHVGLEVESVGHWGNREAVLGNVDRWSAWKKWHPLHNEPDIPVQVWAFARNPG